MSETSPTLVKNPAKVVVLHPQRPAALILRLEAQERLLRGIDEWHLPGGCFEVDKDLTLEDTAIREVDEETGLKIHILGRLGSGEWDAYYDGQPAHFEATFFKAEALPDKQTGQVPEIRMSEESDDAAWVGLERLGDYSALTPEARQYITQALTEVSNA